MSECSVLHAAGLTLIMLFSRANPNLRHPMKRMRDPLLQLTVSMNLVATLFEFQWETCLGEEQEDVVA